MSLSFDSLVLGPCISVFCEVNQGYPAIVYMPISAGAYTIGGIFDPSYEEIIIKNGEPVTRKVPVIGCKASDFTAMPQQDDSVQARGKTYVIREVRDDGHGGIMLMLNSTSLE